MSGNFKKMWRELNHAIWLELCFQKFLRIINSPTTLDTEFVRMQFSWMVQEEISAQAQALPGVSGYETLTAVLNILPDNYANLAQSTGDPFLRGGPSISLDVKSFQSPAELKAYLEESFGGKPTPASEGEVIYEDTSFEPASSTVSKYDLN